MGSAPCAPVVECVGVAVMCSVHCVCVLCRCACVHVCVRVCVHVIQ